MMKTYLLKLFCLILSFILLFTSLYFLLSNNSILSVNTALINTDSSVIIIDAGHGGEDGGAVADDGSVEKKYNLDIALKLESVLKLYGYSVVMTRRTDIMTCDDNLKTQRQRKISDIKNRLAVMNKYSNGIFVSIHQNKFSDPKQNGMQVFYSPNNLKSKYLSECIQSSVVSNMQTYNKRLTKKCGTEIYLLYHAPIPAVLVECGFLSNNNELKMLQKEEYQKKIAILIADGIIKYTNKR